MIRRLLIANRGEIALRIARACRELGIEIVAVHSTVDTESAVVAMADAAVCIGPPRPKDSYLNIPKVIEAALKTGADAVHPGYGFLSEDPDFAEISFDAGLTFVGPRPDVMESRQQGSRPWHEVTRGAAFASRHDQAGEHGRRGPDDRGRDRIPRHHQSLGGGWRPWDGGRGMAVVTRSEDFARTYVSTRATAQAVFGDSSVYLERFLTDARHVEI